MQHVSPEASSEIHLPWNIEQVAAAHTLGVPHTIYRTKNQRKIAFIGLLWLLYIVILISVIFLFLISGADKTWLIWSAWLFFLLLLFGGIAVFLNNLLAPNIEVFVFTNGMIHHKKDLPEAILWEQIESYWKIVSISRDAEKVDTYHYRVRRSDGAKFEFPNTIVDMQKLGDLLRVEADAHLLPPTLAAYQSGVTIPFGRITANQQELRVNGGRKMLPWSELESIRLEDDIIYLYKKGRERAWHQQNIAKIANPGVLQGLVKQIIQDLAQQQLPQVIATYQTGAPIVFGRISLSQQGIALDGGRKLLAWNDVKQVKVDTQERRVSISTYSKLLNWQTLASWMTPNVLVFKELVNYALQEHWRARDARVGNEFPQLLASYNAGIPAIFGRISFNLQGIALDNGRQFLPWNEVSSLSIGTYIGGDRLSIVKKGKKLTWQALHISELGDIALLREFIAHITGQLLP
jgi:hypothetical protein